jgi:hypothetical protein
MLIYLFIEFSIPITLVAEETSRILKPPFLVTTMLWILSSVRAISSSYNSQRVALTYWSI